MTESLDFFQAFILRQALSLLALVPTHCPVLPSLQYDRLFVPPYSGKSGSSLRTSVNLSIYKRISGKTLDKAQGAH